LDGFRKDKVDLCSNLKDLKGKSYFFPKMFTVAPYTFAALHAVFSGMYPSRNGVNAYYNMFKFKKNEITTLSQLLQRAGYHTSCDIISEAVMPKQGFDDWNLFDEETVDFPKRHSELIEKLVKKEKFFLFLHYTETHKHLVREIVKKYKQESNDDGFFSAQIENNERYDSYLPSCNSYVSTILDTIKRAGIANKTIVIFFSDHGTSIGEKKGEKFYGVFAYDYTINIFCILHIPGTKPMIFDKQCRTIDIFPTIAEIAGISLKNNEFERVQGESLFEIIKNPNAKEREVFVETGGLYGPWPSSKKHNVFCVRINDMKLIYNDTPQTWELYNLKEDPGEINNIFDEKSSVVSSMKERLLHYLRENQIDTKLTPTSN
jgi:arylsulfatase A-like enzyme